MNIYQIKRELLDIIDEIEENGGEFTPEQEYNLNIKEEELADKVESYSNVIKYLNDDINSIDSEIKRLKLLSASKTKTIERLQAIVIDAIEQFGATKKSGVKYLDCGTMEVAIRNSKAVSVDDDTLKAISEGVKDNLYNLNEFNQLDVQDRLDFESLRHGIDVYNSNHNDLPFSHITENDLNHTNLELSIKLPMSEFLNGKSYNVIKALAKYPNKYDIKASVAKSEIKKELEEDGACAPNVAKLVTNKTLRIK